MAISLVAAVALALPAAAGAVAFSPIDSDGPLEHVSISNELNCQVIHTADAQAQIYPSVDSDLGACGTEIAVGSTLYGPSDVTGGNNPADFVPVSQTGRTGAGTATDPYKVVTVVNAGPVQITETDTYVEGKDDYRTDLLLRNTSTTTNYPIVLYRFADCFVHEDDQGYGIVTGATVACSTSTDPATAGTLSFVPVTAASRYYEGDYATLYNTMDARSVLPSTCACATLTENAAGLSWSTTLSKNSTKTYSHTTKFLPTGPQQLVTTKTVAKTEVLTGTQVTYTISFKNPTATAATLTEIRDILPAGFTYVAKSSTGQTTTDPVITNGTSLSWSGSWTVAAGATIQQKFKAVANGPAGPLYYNRAGGTAGIRVLPSGPTAPLRICTFVDPVGGHTINGTVGDDVICAGDGDDIVDGLDGNDILIGGKGIDRLTGGNGADTLDGFTENDTLVGGPGADVFIGGAGIDTVEYGPSILNALTIDLNSANGAADGAAGEGDDIRSDVENAVGGGFDDKIVGNPLVNVLDGGAGADTISGAAQTDTLLGGAGFDTLKGNDDGSTKDSLSCQADGGTALLGPNDTQTGCT